MKDKIRTYKGMLIVEATEPIFIEPSKQDIKNAIPGDEENCAYAMYLKRTMHIEHVKIMRTEAYVQSKQQPPQGFVSQTALGKKFVMKHYIIKSNSVTRKYMQDFDEGQKWAPMEKFILSVPSKSRNLGYQKEVTVNYKGPKKSLIEPMAKTKVSYSGNGSFRNGTGRVKFDIV